jgi:mannosidase alpha-like ER degradation enhancer 2
LGNRLLPAFRTNTGIPYGTVNLRYGVPRGETEIASTAGAGSLIVEFEALSSLTKDRRYGDAAYGATQALFDRRSPIGLLGKHIHTKTGRWFESVSGIGSNSDSFYEYLLKSFLLYRREKMYRMFTDTFAAIKRFVQVGDWFNDVDMFNGKLRRNRVENLAAFWPGLEASLGFSGESSRQLNTLYAVWADLGFLPEEFDNVQWQATHAAGSSSSGAAAAQHINAFYPLRPELIESTYHQYRTTGDRSWLAAGELFLSSLEDNTRTSCGFATVSGCRLGERKRGRRSMELDLGHIGL